MRFVNVLFRWAGAGWSVQRWNLLTDDRIIWGFVDIDLRPMRVVLGHVGVRENRFDRTLGHARIAIDACVRVDVEAVRQFMECLDGADGGAVGVLAINA